MSSYRRPFVLLPALLLGASFTLSGCIPPDEVVYDVQPSDAIRIFLNALNAGDDQAILANISDESPRQPATISDIRAAFPDTDYEPRNWDGEAYTYPGEIAADTVVQVTVTLDSSSFPGGRNYTFQVQKREVGGLFPTPVYRIHDWSP